MPTEKQAEQVDILDMIRKGNTQPLATLSWDDLWDLRNRAGADKELQNLIAPFEHRAFAREQVQENPLRALTLPVMVPAYSAYKAMGFGNTRSDPSFAEVGQGYMGIGEGLLNSLVGAVQAKPTK